MEVDGQNGGLFLSCLFINCLSHMSLKDEGREPSAKETGTSLSAW